MSNSRVRAKTWPYPRHNEFEKELRQKAAAWFQKKEFPVSSRYAYLLKDRDNWHQNIIDPQVVAYIKQEKTTRPQLPLHKYIHHGLSSQAMLFNLVGSLIVRNDLHPLKIAFSRQGITWPENIASASFEYENREVFNEDSGQPTSIDLVLEDASGKPLLFVESKLVEREFGRCSVFELGDCDGRDPAGDFSQCYLHHIGRNYLDLMDKYGFFSGSLQNNVTCILANYYQFFREVLFALEMGGSFILIYDSRNPTFICQPGQRGLMPFLTSLIPEAYHSRITSVTIQDIVNAIKESQRHEWITEFEKKYGL